MDLSVKGPEGKFNFRVAALFIHEGRILILRDESCPIDYLPGGRAHLFEPADEALARELREELGIAQTPPHRPVFVAENFYRVEADESASFRGDFHEVLVCFLVEPPQELLDRGERFVIREESDNPEDREVHCFRWAEFGELAGLPFIPEFLKTRIHDLPEGVEYISAQTEGGKPVLVRLQG